MKKMKKMLLLFIILSISNCAVQKTKYDAIASDDDVRNEKTIQDTIDEEENGEKEDIASQEPLLLGGRPYIDSQGKVITKGTGIDYDYIRIGFEPDVQGPWNNLDGIEQLVNLKRVSIHDDGGDIGKVDLSSISLLVNLEELFIRGNITRLPESSTPGKAGGLNCEPLKAVCF